jgi:hypothetical protein
MLFLCRKVYEIDTKTQIYVTSLVGRISTRRALENQVIYRETQEAHRAEGSLSLYHNTSIK